MRRTCTVLVLTAIVAALLQRPVAPAHAARAHAQFMFVGAGYTLVLHSQKLWYGTRIYGTLTWRHAGHGQNFHAEGDWIPAGDAGGDLLRFYGHPFARGNDKGPYGLVSVATFYDTCVPNCAQSRTYALTALPNVTYMTPGLPGSHLRTVHLFVQPVR